MLFGQWQDQKDRQRKVIKTKIYKQMLDNQILINERYKHKKANKQLQDQSAIVQKNIQNDRKNIKNNLNDLDVSIPEVRKKDKNVNLPSIKDKNTYYHGSSKFIKVENVDSKPLKQGHIKTELIEEEEDELDQYNNTCQKIIRELKSINKQTPKMKFRRKLYQYSDLAPNKKRYQKNRIEQLTKNQAKVYNNYDYRTNKINKNEENSFQNISIKPNVDKEDRAPSLNLIKPSKQNKNQQITKSKRLNTQPQPSKTIIPSIQRTKPKQQYKNMPINQFDQSQEIDENQKTNKKIEQISGLKDIPPTNKSNNVQKNRIKSYVEVNKYSPRMAQSEKQDKKLNESQLKLHKQNFIDLLRKVKNRGQSLFIKLSALPLTKNQAKK